MKSIAILALLGLTSAAEVNENQLSSNLIRLNTYAYGDDDSDSDGDDDDEEEIQTRDDDEEVDHSKEFFGAHEHGGLGVGGDGY